jgi:hypothetical protein
MPFELEALRANKGDCLLLHFGTNATPRLAVIDGGPARTYEPALKPRLEKIRQARAAAPGTPLTIDLLMVSHIDDDHIHGILELTGEMVEAKDKMQPLPFRVRRVWHNSFSDLIEISEVDLRASLQASFGAASTSDMALSRSPNLSIDAAKILVSVGQGINLRDHLRKLDLSLNPPFANKIVMQNDAVPRDVLEIDEGLKLTVVGPREPELIALREQHKKFLEAKAKKEASPESALAAFSDKSVPNLSSIVVLAEQGGKTMLLTGDARGDNILAGLRTANLLTDAMPCTVDVLKVPHHGSDNNVTKEFFQQVPATHYVFSGNGQHGNPERATFDMLFEARRALPGGGAPIKLHFTYPIDEIDDARQLEWDKELMKGRKTRAWNPKLDSLAAFFKSAEGGPVKFDCIDSVPISIAP